MLQRTSAAAEFFPSPTDDEVKESDADARCGAA
jgi:hypothetical protein